MVGVKICVTRKYGPITFPPNLPTVGSVNAVGHQQMFFDLCRDLLGGKICGADLDTGTTHELLAAWNR